MSILVIDVGSSSVRALLFEDTLERIPDAEACRPCQFDTLPSGAATCDPLELQRLVEICIDEILQHPAANDIQAVGVDTFVGNVMGVDADNVPLTPIYTYADTRSRDDMRLLGQQIDHEQAYARTGTPLHTAYLPARLHWLRRTEPNLFDNVACWVDFGTYLYRCWFKQSELPCSYSVASWTGLLNRRDLEWDSEWLDMLAMPATVLPPLADYDTTQCSLVNDYAKRWPSLEDIPFCLALGDGASANVGSGCVSAHYIALTVGTTAALRVASSQLMETVPAGLWDYRITADLHLTGGATSEGGNIFAWARKALNIGDLQAVETALLEQPDEHGLTFLPLMAGERSPGWQAEATGTIHGIRLATTAEQMLQAALEGVALRLAAVSEQLESVASSDAKVIASGGAMNVSASWAQVIANALNRSLYISDETEITARGTALLAQHAISQKTSLSAAVPHIVKEIEPQPAAVKKLAAARQRQQELYDLLYQ